MLHKWSRCLLASNIVVSTTLLVLVFLMYVPTPECENILIDYAAGSIATLTMASLNTLSSVVIFSTLL
jgi:hypothetical protein